MTSEELQEIWWRYNETTDTEWTTCCIGKDDPQFPPHVVCDLHPVGGLDLPATDEDAIFMAAAHADIPRLLDEVERLEEIVRDLAVTHDPSRRHGFRDAPLECPLCRKQMTKNVRKGHFPKCPYRRAVEWVKRKEEDNE